MRLSIQKNPKPSSWASLCSRPKIDSGNLNASVSEILTKVRREGDSALRYYSEKFDNTSLDSIAVDNKTIALEAAKVSSELKSAIAIAAKNIETFHAIEATSSKVETMPGVTCEAKWKPIQSVGLYIPGGTAPLFSTVLMLAIPARLAGCSNIVLCTPPDKNGNIPPAVLYAAKIAGVHSIYKIGGAQAIAAMAYGTETIPAVDKIFGPGNQYVTKAKQIIASDGIAIDMPAGPSEVLVIADQDCNPEFVAADLLSQAEHGVDSQVVLVCNAMETIEKINDSLVDQLATLPRNTIATEALKNSNALLFNSLDTAMDFSNQYAPEHLILAVSNAEALADKVENAGSVFLGNFTPESAGDYASGTNHTLPTNGFAKSYSGVSTYTFMKRITFQKITEKGIQNIGNAIEVMAEAEALYAHKNAVSLRLNYLEK